MKLEINVPISGLDLANLLEGEQGLFLCQNRGQNYITVAKAGHSIALQRDVSGCETSRSQLRWWRNWKRFDAFLSRVA
jgi:hypothetical protein